MLGLTRSLLPGLAACALGCAADGPAEPPLPGCPDSGAGADACRLERIVAGQEPAEACGALGTLAVRDACWLAIAERERTLETCAAIVHPAWRGHCGLELLERRVTQLTPVQWVEACSQWSGAMVHECLQHGADMWSRGMSGQEGRPRFARATLEAEFAAIYGAATRAGIERHHWEADPLEAVDRLYLRLLAVAREEPLAASCRAGGLPRTVCAEAGSFARLEESRLQPGRVRWREGDPG